MFQHQLEQQDKSIANRIGDAMARWVPRKAVVVRPDRNGVWVRFATESSTSPQSWFVSTVSGVPGGTSGWVFALGGGKGLFIATGVPKGRATSNGSSTSGTISTSGDYQQAVASVKVADLSPGATITVKCDLYMTVAIAPSSSLSPGFVIVRNGGTSTVVGGAVSAGGGGRVPLAFSYALDVVVPDDGIVTATPIVRWNAGTITMYSAYATIQVI